MYATVEDIQARYGDDTYIFAGTLADGSINKAALSRAVEEASSEIDLALQGRYALPLHSVPPVIRRICVDIAVAALPRNGATEATVYERRGREARALLASLSKGEISLGEEASPAPAQGTGGGMAYFFSPSGFRAKLDEL
ncbi:MAG: DUF1320 domain-containing protein [Desulfovibrionaceae bacterium]